MLSLETQDHHFKSPSKSEHRSEFTNLLITSRNATCSTSETRCAFVCYLPPLSFFWVTQLAVHLLANPSTVPPLETKMLAAGDLFCDCSVAAKQNCVSDLPRDEHIRLSVTS
jgi:hypothetical protein